MSNLIKQLNRLAVYIFVVAGLLLAASSHAEIVIGPGDPPCFVDPTQPQCRKPVLIVPGLGASYNKKLMLKDQASDNWKFAPSVDWFDSLITRLENEGYEEGKDLFIVHYDWRQPNLYSAIQYLVPAINQAKQISGGDKVDIIAHSMGGLVARAYAQSENLYNEDVDQLIFLGTPNAGAAGAYIAWEGGDFPPTWDFWTRQWIRRIEEALKKTRYQPDLKRPLSFRAFFPSLKDLLPIEDYLTQDGNPIAVGDVTEQNDFILQRWRDGHANPDPPQPNSSQGDQTVLTESVQSISANSNIVLDNIRHEELPGEAQNHLAQLLTQNPQADFIPAILAQAAVGIDILSPAVPTVTGPNGEILSPDQNTFPNADYDWDQTDPDDTIKSLTITDPPDGEYTVQVTGTDASQPFMSRLLPFIPFALAADSEYTIVISYADQDDTEFFEQTQPTEPDQIDTYYFTIGAGQFQMEKIDIKELLQQLIAQAKQTKKDCPLKGYQRANITRPATHALSDLTNYEQRLANNRQSSASRQLRSFYQHLDEINRALHFLPQQSNCQNLINNLIALLDKIRANAPR
ncbi:MAG: hypothetical protein UW94_C0020G0016 [Parcubacteria group bacterium GW2011_GWA2_45_14]|nr:MAG: hypothetical protein UW94_C0020G0016 [Parcubacteria group bacterium GW2011_GWA2_45_14]